ncbi:MAG: glycosyltransferase family 39 protein [Phycisphaerae bacterium]
MSKPQATPNAVPASLVATDPSAPVADWNIPHWGALAIITAFALPLFLELLGHGQAKAMMELFNLVPIREAYRDGHWLIPTLGGAPRLQKPPLPVWIPAVLAVLFHSDNLWVVRLPSVLLGLATCWATYGIGCITSRDRRLGLFAAIALASMVVFIRQARMASYDIYGTAFTTLGFLGLLAAAEYPRRWWIWSGLGGVALGLSVLSKGPVPPMYVLAPFGFWLLWKHRKNRRCWLGILLALVVSIAVFTPWLLAVAVRYHAQYGGSAWQIWVRQFRRYVTVLPDTRWYYLAMIAWVFPWTPPLIAGLALPFLPTQSNPPPTAQERRSRWMFWMILVVGLILLTIPAQKKQRYALQNFPFAALLIAAVWQEFVRLKKNLRLEAPAKVLLAAQSIMFVGAGVLILVLIPIVMLAHHPSLNHVGHWTAMQAASLLQPGLAALTPIGWGLVALVIIGLGVLLWRWEFSRHWDRSFWVYAVAGWLFMLAMNWAYMDGQGYQVSRYRAETRQMISAVHGRKIYTLKGDEMWLGVLYYANEILPLKTPHELVAIAEHNKDPIYVLTRDAGVFQQQIRNIAKQTRRHIRIIDRINDGHYIQSLFQLSYKIR